MEKASAEERDRRVIADLVEGMKPVDLASAYGVDASTVARWVHEALNSNALISLLDDRLLSFVRLADLEAMLSRLVHEGEYDSKDVRLYLDTIRNSIQLRQGALEDAVSLTERVAEVRLRQVMPLIASAVYATADEVLEASAATEFRARFRDKLAATGEEAWE